MLPHLVQFVQTTFKIKSLPIYNTVIMIIEIKVTNQQLPLPYALSAAFDQCIDHITAPPVAKAKY